MEVDRKLRGYATTTVTIDLVTEAGKDFNDGLRNGNISEETAAKYLEALRLYRRELQSCPWTGMAQTFKTPIDEMIRNNVTLETQKIGLEVSLVESIAMRFKKIDESGDQV